MESKDPDELIEEVRQEHQTRGELAKEALEWFLDGNVGEFYPRDGVVTELSEHLDVSSDRANLALSDTVGDIVDPVQQITKSGERYVGIINYKDFTQEGAYGYTHFDDLKGPRKRVVCARCVEKYEQDASISHATQGEGTADPNANWQQLLNIITSHYANDHSESPENIEPGASLVSGTTIGGNTAFHQGNENLIDAGGADVQVFNSNGTWNKPSSGSLVNVLMAAGGGSGGNAGGDSTDSGREAVEVGMRSLVR
ncbi:MAG: hypothetical protein J07AB43_01360 [Candidatus Nanosalina sp. J07AB43]|nr:MAG: hypothetical protein J07AB43_01360 [Candidatus Nanosalina sp. J07AB43]